jgi:SAM-dependent methyltransferase
MVLILIADNKLVNSYHAVEGSSVDCRCNQKIRQGVKRMFRYYLTGMTLKLFSCCGYTRNMYRIIGNSLGAKKRTEGLLPYYYVDRAKRLVDSISKYQLFSNGGNVLEVGTGWMHWEALTARLFFDFEATLFDVWDNRQLSGLKNFLGQLEPLLDEFNVSDSQKERAGNLIKDISKVESFDQLYKLLDFKYVLDPGGISNNFKPKSFDCIISAGVLEHVKKGQLPQMLSAFRDTLKPTGYSIHSINLRDHLWPYSRMASSKQYLKYSEKHWRFLLDNEVQYINRIQRPEWIDFFDKAGFIMVEEEHERIKELPRRISKIFRSYPQSDLEITWLRMIHAKGAVTV